MAQLRRAYAEPDRPASIFTSAVSAATGILELIETVKAWNARPDNIGASPRVPPPPRVLTSVRFQRLVLPVFSGGGSGDGSGDGSGYNDPVRGCNALNAMERLVLVLGHEDGVEVWNLGHDGSTDVMEQLACVRGDAWCGGVVRTACTFGGYPGPVRLAVHSFHNNAVHVFSLFYDDGGTSGMTNDQTEARYSSKTTTSTSSSTPVARLSFEKSDVFGVTGGERLLAVSLSTRIVAFDPTSLSQLFVISCFPNHPRHSDGVVAIGSRWLAFASDRPLAVSSSSTSPLLATSVSTAPSSAAAAVGAHRLDSQDVSSYGILGNCTESRDLDRAKGVAQLSQWRQKQQRQHGGSKLDAMSAAQGLVGGIFWLGARSREAAVVTSGMVTNYYYTDIGVSASALSSSATALEREERLMLAYHAELARLAQEQAAVLGIGGSVDGGSSGAGSGHAANGSSRSDDVGAEAAAGAAAAGGGSKGLLGAVAKAFNGAASAVAGTVAVLDLCEGRVVAHFRAEGECVAAVAWGAAGDVLVTASASGQTLHVWAVSSAAGANFIESTALSLMSSSAAGVAAGAMDCDQPSIMSKQQPSSRLIFTLRYKLVRGFTPAKIRHMSVSASGKWAAISTARGTSHVFALQPRGGKVDGSKHVPGIVATDAAVSIAAAAATVAATTTAAAAVTAEATGGTAAVTAANDSAQTAGAVRSAAVVMTMISTSDDTAVDSAVPPSVPWHSSSSSLTASRPKSTAVHALRDGQALGALLQHAGSYSNASSGIEGAFDGFGIGGIRVGGYYAYTTCPECTSLRPAVRFKAKCVAALSSAHRSALFARMQHRSVAKPTAAKNDASESSDDDGTNGKVSGDDTEYAGDDDNSDADGICDWATAMETTNVMATRVAFAAHVIEHEHDSDALPSEEHGRVGGSSGGGGWVGFGGCRRGGGQAMLLVISPDGRLSRQTLACSVEEKYIPWAPSPNESAVERGGGGSGGGSGSAGVSGALGGLRALVSTTGGGSGYVSAGSSLSSHCSWRGTSPLGSHVHSHGNSHGSNSYGNNPYTNSYGGSSSPLTTAMHLGLGSPDAIGSEPPNRQPNNSAGRDGILMPPSATAVRAVYMAAGRVHGEDIAGCTVKRTLVVDLGRGSSIGHGVGGGIGCARRETTQWNLCKFTDSPGVDGVRNLHINTPAALSPLDAGAATSSYSRGGTAYNGVGSGASYASTFAQSWLVVFERRTRPPAALLQPPLWASPNASVSAFASATATHIGNSGGLSRTSDYCFIEGDGKRWCTWGSCHLRLEDHENIKSIVPRRPSPLMATAPPPSPLVPTSQRDEEMQFILTDDEGTDLTDGEDFAVIS